MTVFTWFDNADCNSNCKPFVLNKACKIQNWYQILVCTLCFDIMKLCINYYSCNWSSLVAPLTLYNVWKGWGFGCDLYLMKLWITRQAITNIKENDAQIWSLDKHFCPYNTLMLHGTCTHIMLEIDTELLIDICYESLYSWDFYWYN